MAFWPMSRRKRCGARSGARDPARAPLTSSRPCGWETSWGGHFVSGHIDGVGQLWEQAATGNAWELSFKVPAEIGRYIVPKGSVAVNGVSLTVAEVRQGGCWFKVAVIPQTYRETNLSLLQVGDPVNVEADMLGKYVEKLLGLAPPESGLSLEFLAEHGYV